MIQNLDQLYAELNTSKNVISNITYDTSKFYYKKIKPKKKFGNFQVDENGCIRLRHLFPPTQLLKIIQQKVCFILNKIQMPDCMFGSVAGSNNIINALEHLENKYFFKIDLKNFFSNITNKQVHSTFIENNFSWEVARILTKLTTYQCALPQGAPSSPVIANLVFAKTARQLEDLIREHDITFTIFLDDLVFSSKKDFKCLCNHILNIIRANKFFPHNDKIHYRKYKCEITGLIIKDRKLKVIQEMQNEALTNSRIRGYIKSVNEHYNFYLANKNNFTTLH